jgi:hypothetical protein
VRTATGRTFSSLATYFVVDLDCCRQYQLQPLKLNATTTATAMANDHCQMMLTMVVLRELPLVV